jgi:hypothetical protein
MQGELSSKVLLELTHKQNRRRRINALLAPQASAVEPSIGKNVQRSLKELECIKQTGDAETASTLAASTVSPICISDTTPNPNSNPGHMAPSPMRPVSVEFF